MNAPVTERIQTSPGETLAVLSDRQYTADELLEISADTSCVYELKKGILTIMSPAGRDYGKIALRIGARIHIYVEEKNLGETFAAETGFKVEENPDTVMAPDASFVATEHLPTDGVSTTYFPGPPDLAVEVVSPGDRASEVQEKVQAWLSFGVALVWIIEPKSRTVTVYRADNSVTVLDGSATLDGEDVLPGFQFPLRSLFR